MNAIHLYNPCMIMIKEERKKQEVEKECKEGYKKEEKVRKNILSVLEGK